MNLIISSVDLTALETLARYAFSELHEGTGTIDEAKYQAMFSRVSSRLAQVQD